MHHRRAEIPLVKVRIERALHYLLLPFAFLHDAFACAPAYQKSAKATIVLRTALVTLSYKLFDEVASIEGVP